ncbi:hypothetical protein LCGC14_1488690 [marine sediment metagenome]|uniref:Uncharacterized protein n=1 Tax=marine sediment metagenome TaxID=412755 RepID=A0A0F9J7D8_9ZZZZ
MSTSNGTANGLLSKAGRAIFQPLIQGGFACFSVLLLGVVVWMMNKNDQRFDKLLLIQQETNQVIERNTAAIVELSRVVHSSYGRSP